MPRWAGKKKLKLDTMKNFLTEGTKKHMIMVTMVSSPGELSKHLLNWNDREKIGLAL